MSKSKTKKIKPLSAKKQNRMKIIGQLQTALPALAEMLGKKEFESRIKKAAKLLTAGVKIKPAKPAKIKPAGKDKTASEEIPV